MYTPPKLISPLTQRRIKTRKMPPAELSLKPYLPQDPAPNPLADSRTSGNALESGNRQHGLCAY